MISFDKLEVRKQITAENIFDFLQEWGGDPIYTPFGMISATICHNDKGNGSHKLYYYNNTGLFRCYTGCEEPNFDIYELVIKIMKIQKNLDWDLDTAVKYIANKFNILIYKNDFEDKVLGDWKIFSNYERIQDITLNTNKIVLKEYEEDILDRFNYTVKLTPWLNEDITQEVLDYARIGFYPGGDQITIPHYDENDRFIGLRGRTLNQEEAEIFGKYRPIKVNNMMYNHPLGMNLYGLNWAKDNIKVIQKAIVVESEKSVLKYQSYFGIENNIAVACCGSNLSNYQVQLLLRAGAKEIIIGFDRQFQNLGDKEFLHLRKNLTQLHNKYKNEALISFIFDKHKITAYKNSPLDEGKEKFLTLFKERIIL